MARKSHLLSAKEAKAIDLKARKMLGISVLVLMENAGREIAAEAIQIRRAKARVAILCGKGNNGGDGFVAARHLLVSGIKAEIFLAGSIKDVKNEARVNLEILRKLKHGIIQIKERDLAGIKRKISRYPLIIDALLGVGLKGEVRGIYKDLIGLINSSKANILSVDIPSGLNATTGRVLGACVKADRTVTFVAKKRGMVIGDGPKFCGRVIVKDLGIPL
ncbi:NAD(P)H-hydrate epimerase [Candidatus Omnitrophota bacterium]